MADNVDLQEAWKLYCRQVVKAHDIWTKATEHSKLQRKKYHHNPGMNTPEEMLQQVDYFSYEIEYAFLHAEGTKVYYGAKKFWAEAVLRHKGNIKLEWVDWYGKYPSYDCILETGERFKFDPKA